MSADDVFIGRLRAAGGSPIYTRYGTDGHDGAIRAGMSCPAMVDWVLAQRRGQDTLTVLYTPIRAALFLQPKGMVLSWNGGVTPFQVQRSIDLVDGSWIPILTDAVSPVTLSPEHDHEF